MEHADERLRLPPATIEAEDELVQLAQEVLGADAVEEASLRRSTDSLQDLGDPGCLANALRRRRSASTARPEARRRAVEGSGMARTSNESRPKAPVLVNETELTGIS